MHFNILNFYNKKSDLRKVIKNFSFLFLFSWSNIALISWSVSLISQICSMSNIIDSQMLTYSLNDKLKIICRKHFSGFLLNISFSSELCQKTICSIPCSRVAVYKFKNCKPLRKKFTLHGIIHIYIDSKA